VITVALAGICLASVLAFVPTDSARAVLGRWQVGLAGAPAQARVMLNIEYRRVGGERLRLDAYVPVTQRARPALVFIHGGGWRSGDKAFFAPGEQAFAPVGERLAAAGIATFSVNYRFAPFPAALSDVTAAVRWLRSHAARFGFEPSKIAVFGASAGGNLAALVATSGQSERTTGARVLAGVSWSGPMDLALFDRELRRGSSHPFVEDYIGCEPASCPSNYARASPVSFVDRSDPPMLIVNGSNEIVPLAQAQELAHRLGQAHVEHTLIIVKGGLHAAQYSARALTPTIRFLIKYLERPG
jgi:acetyl esterase/lipase